MTTASVLMTVTTNWNVSSEKLDKEGCLGKANKSCIIEAAQEIRETPAIREQGLRIMREWIQQNNDLRNVRTDDAFLLRFLRQKKYSIPMAQQTLLKYLGLRKYYPEIFKNLDCEDVKLKDIINNGYMAISPVRDAKGRRIILYSMSKFDATKYNCWDMCRVHAVIYETLMDDPLDQMCGFVHVGDGHGVTSGHIISWNPTDFARIMKWGEHSVPMRHREVHMINVPAAVKYVIDFAASKISPKMSERINIHCNPKTLTKKVDAACLPTEFGGKLQYSEFIAYTKKMLQERRQVTLDSENMELLSTRGIISSRRPSGTQLGEGSVEGSFRKLEID